MAGQVLGVQAKSVSRDSFRVTSSSMLVSLELTWFL
jgi:hypothetical protein